MDAALVLPRIDRDACDGCGDCVADCDYCTDCEAACPVLAIACPFEVVVAG
ncbi:MAG: hypothetical protein HYY88_12225 [candidate division NC10 bacterium]|nr:hypothetical protein [candidate division NC10 bacterium]